MAFEYEVGKIADALNSAEEIISGIAELVGSNAESILDDLHNAQSHLTDIDNAPDGMDLDELKRQLRWADESIDEVENKLGDVRDQVHHIADKNGITLY